MVATKTKLMALADKFVEAGYSRVSIDPVDDLKCLGITKIPKTFKSNKYGTIKLANGWESFCCYVYEKVSGEPHPGSQARGTGFRSQEYGREVANMIRKVADNLKGD